MGKSKISEEIWLRNEDLQIGERLYQLYIWFSREKDYEIETVLEILGPVV